MEFIKLYNSLKTNFKSANLFTLIKGSSNAIQWPKASGVYTIWHKNSENIDNLIYIGMTGKFNRNDGENVTFNNASFESRISRYTPYRFCENLKDKNMKFYFRYGPKSSNTKQQDKIKYDLDAYKHSIPYLELEIHCFHIGSDHTKYSPALLESLLLTKYLKTKNNLPPANNSL